VTDHLGRLHHVLQKYSFDEFLREKGNEFVDAACAARTSGVCEWGVIGQSEKQMHSRGIAAFIALLQLLLIAADCE
jgi:hypothetical protein